WHTLFGHDHPCLGLVQGQPLDEFRAGRDGDVASSHRQDVSHGLKVEVDPGSILQRECIRVFDEHGTAHPSWCVMVSRSARSGSLVRSKRTRYAAARSPRPTSIVTRMAEKMRRVRWRGSMTRIGVASRNRLATQT